MKFLEESPFKNNLKGLWGGQNGFNAYLIVSSALSKAMLLLSYKRVIKSWSGYILSQKQLWDSKGHLILLRKSWKSSKLPLTSKRRLVGVVILLPFFRIVVLPRYVSESQFRFPIFDILNWPFFYKSTQCHHRGEESTQKPLSLLSKTQLCGLLPLPSHFKWGCSREEMHSLPQQEEMC